MMHSDFDVTIYADLDIDAITGGGLILIMTMYTDIDIDDIH